MITQNNDAIVLHRKVFSEQDFLVECFSKQFGKIQCIAKSGAKIQSKLAGKLNPLNVVSLQLFKGKSFYTITDVQISNNFSESRTSFNHLQLALFFISVVRKSVEFNQKHSRLYALLYKVLQDCSLLKDMSAIKQMFYHHYLELEGIKPAHIQTLTDSDFVSLVQNYIEKPIRLPLQIK